MKTKFLLFAAFLGCASLMAQSEKSELMLNGGFEDTDYTPFYWGEEDTQPKPQIVLGWDLQTTNQDSLAMMTEFKNAGMDRWNVYCRYVKHDDVASGAEEGATINSLITDDNYQFMRLQRQEWNGWHTTGLQSTHEVAAGTDYDFSCIYAGMTVERRKNGDGWEGEVIRRIRIYEEEVSDENVVMESIIEDASSIPWSEYKDVAKASQAATKFIVRMELNGHGEDDSKGGTGMNKVWFDFDDVSLIGVNLNPGGDGVEEYDPTAAISVYKLGNEVVIANAPLNSEVNLYTVAGNLLKSAAVDSEEYNLDVNGYQAGVYVVQVAGKSFKIVL